MIQFRISWESYESIAQARTALWTAVLEKRWDVFGLEQGPMDDRVLTREDEDGLHVYMPGDWQTGTEGEAL